MTEAADRRPDRVARRSIDKFAGRRDELASAAIQTLARLGIARTTIREIAQNSAFSHGVLHYYFSDKSELITFALQQYMTESVARYKALTVTEVGPEDLERRFAAGMLAALRDDGLFHRLWYDLRNYSQYDDALRAHVNEIDNSKEQMLWQVVATYAQLSGARPALSPRATYSVFDGLFRGALNAHLAGDQQASVAFEQDVRSLLELVTEPLTEPPEGS